MNYERRSQCIDTKWVSVCVCECRRAHHFMAIVFRVERHSIKGKTCQGDRFGRIRPVSVLWLAMLDSFCARAHSFTQFFSRRRQYKDRFGLFSSFFLRFGSHIRNENREQESRMDSSFWCLGKL